MAIVPRSLTSTVIASMLLVASTNAFVPSSIMTPTTTNGQITSSMAFWTAPPTSSQQRSRSRPCFMSEEIPDQAAQEEQYAAEEESPSKSTEEEAAEEEVKEDPEITAIKEEIANLESELKAKRIEASRTMDLADDYSERGYQRKCAEMDNYRRTVSATSNSNLQAAKANILQSLLPNLDDLNNIVYNYSNNEFAQSYSALRNDFASSLASMGVSEYIPEIGSVMDTRRCHVLSEQEVDEVDDAGIILSVEREGYDVDGNVIRLAEVVVSKGKEVEEEPEGEGEGEGEEMSGEEGIVNEE